MYICTGRECVRGVPGSQGYKNISGIVLYKTSSPKAIKLTSPQTLKPPSSNDLKLGVEGLRI